MPSSEITISQYEVNPPLEVDADSSLEVRGWYTRSYIAADGVTPVQGSSTNGASGFYYSSTPLLVDGILTVLEHAVQPTTESNPTANYFEDLWIDGAFATHLMPNGQGATGWQIPTVYGDTISFDEIATYNRAVRLLYPPNTYFTADQTIQEIERLAGQFDYAGLNIYGITSLDIAPVTASIPIALGQNSRRAPDFYNIMAYGALTTNTAAQNATAITSAITAATVAGGGIYVPVGTFITNSIAVSVPIQFAPGASILSPATGQTITITKSLIADVGKHFNNATAGLGTISFSGNKVLSNVWGEWWGATGNGTTNDVAALQAACTALDSGAGGTLWLNGATYNIGSTLSIGSASAQHYINIQGIGPVTSILSYSGATNSIAVKLNNEKYTALKGVRINNAVAKGTTEGVRSTGPNVGTNTTGLFSERLIIDGFHYGWHTSDGGTNTSSELSLNAVTFQNCDTGLLNESFNAISVNLYNCGFALNTIGVDNEAGENMNLFGGSFSTNTTDLKLRASTSLYGIYTESTVGAALDIASGAGNTKVTAINCTLGNGASTPNTHTMVTISGGKTILDNCNIYGQVVFTQSDVNRAISMRDCHVIDPNNTYTATATPDNMGPGFRLLANSGSGGNFESINNTQCNNDLSTIVAVWPSGVGFVPVSATGQGFCFMRGNGGSTVASATAIIPSGSVFHVTGVTSITSITSTSFIAGQEITIIFDGILTFTDGNNLKLAGNFVTSADDTITLKWDGTSWFEMSRSVN